MIDNRDCSVFLILTTVILFVFPAAADLEAAQTGIKYNRPKFEYPGAALRDFERFHSDRIDAVMIALPWAEWEPREGQIDEDFIETGLGPVLEFAAENGMEVMLASHSSFWGAKGDWTIPGWVREKETYDTSASALTNPEVRKLHTSFLTRLIGATHRYAAVRAYNILNEPVVATRWYLRTREGRPDFDARWEGVFQIALDVKRYMTQQNVKQLLIIGNASADRGYEKFVWDHTGKRDLAVLWTRIADRIASQGVPSLIASAKWYPSRPRIRTEGLLTYATLAAWREKGDIRAVRTQWSENADYSQVTYDYDAVYDYEGLSNAAVPDLETFYVWRVGAIDGSKKSLLVLDHRNRDRPTPYYYALRDLASGIDSFETLDPAHIPESGKESLALNPGKVRPGISKRWTGTGTVRAEKDLLPPDTETRGAARIALEPGENAERSVISAHWKGSGVKETDSLTFLAYSEEGAELDLIVHFEGGSARAPFSLSPGKWEKIRISFTGLGLTESDVFSIRSAGFENRSGNEAVFIVDEFLVRP